MNRPAFDYQYGDDIEATATRGLPMLDAPLCEADAEARRLSLAEDAAERAARIAAKAPAERAELRARCRTNHAREVHLAASRLRYALAAAHRDGFDTPHAREVSELMARTVRSLVDQKDAA